MACVTFSNWFYGSVLSVALIVFLPISSVEAEQEQPNIEDYSKPLPFWTQQEKLIGFRNIANMWPTREIKAGDYVLPLPNTSQDLSQVTYKVGDDEFTLSDYIHQRQVVGLLVVHKGKVLYERYAQGNDANSHWISFSVAKSVSSMLIGAAIQDGFIKSVDDPVTDYLPRLHGSSYANTTIKDVLQMASGVDWNEDYADPNSDVNQAAQLNAMDLFDYLNTLPIAAKPGERFNYNTGETNLVGAIVRAAVGNNQSAYLERKIWQPFGMESDATWVTDLNHGVELGGCCINATLRDYARIGLFAMNDGVLADGKRILPEGWMRASTTPSKAYGGYGYLWWLEQNDTYAALGIHGQMIWIEPKTETIIVTHSAWPTAVGQDHSNHRWAMVKAVHKFINK